LTKCIVEIQESLIAHILAAILILAKLLILTLVIASKSGEWVVIVAPSITESIAVPTVHDFFVILTALGLFTSEFIIKFEVTDIQIFLIRS
jgi:hypothetical protein